MNTADITLIRSSFTKVAPIADVAAGLFYDRLFELDENLRPLFHSDLEKQGRLLMQMISTAVDHLDDLGKLVPLVQKLGERHKIYGVEPRPLQHRWSGFALDTGAGSGRALHPRRGTCVDQCLWSALRSNAGRGWI